MPRNVHLAARAGADMVIALADSEDARKSLWKRERKAERQLLSTPSANQWFTEEVRSW